MAALTLGIAAPWILFGLLGHDPWKPDEAYIFGLVYHVLQGGGWVVPTLAGEPFLQQPPLYILTAALFAKIFSFALPLHDGARLASGAYIAIAFGFTAAAGRELNGSNRGWVSLLLLLGSVGLVVRAHQIIPDTALLAGFAMGCYGLARMPLRWVPGGLWLGTGIGVSFLAKGLLGPGVLVVATAALLLLCRPWRRRSAAAATLLALLAALPWLVAWPLALYRESPALFSAWWSESLSCFTTFQGAHNRLHYVRILPWYAWPSLPLALWVLWGTRVSRFARPAIQLPIVLFVVAFVALTLCSPARELNAMSLLVPLALLATPAIDQMRRGAVNSMYWFGVMTFTFFTVVGWVYWSGLELGIPRRLSAHLHRLQPAYVSEVRWLPLVVALALCSAWFILLAKLRRSVERPVIVWAAGMTLVWGLLNTLFLEYADVNKSYRSMIAELKSTLPERYDCIAGRDLGESQRALLQYFAGIVTVREQAGGGTSCELLLAQGLRSEPPEIPPGWHQIWEGTRPGEDDEYFWLYGYGPPQPVY